jgi:RNA methyltransferase, TrmH family
MLSKNEVKYIQSLYQKKTRNDEGLFVAEGPKIMEELVYSDYRIRKVYATDKWSRPENLPVEIILVNEDELGKISNLQTANEVLAVVEQNGAG